jgi:glycosyltransferase involved in cell wall biosynthesis
VVHDHTSGARDVPEGLKRWAKMARYCVPGMSADRAIAVSDFVLERLVRVNLLPPGRTSRIWNSVEVPEALVPEDRRKARLRDLGLDPLRPVVGCASRATPEKGIKPLLLAFDRVWRDFPGREKPQLIYMGSGPAWDEFSRIREKLPSRDGITLAGYVPDAADVLGCVDVAVVPSLWEEAFGLAALEPMARGIPVIASRVGGIPEVIQEGETGLLVSAGDEEALAEAIAHLLTHPSLAEEFGRRGRDRALAAFSREKQVDALESLFREEMRRW